MKDVPVAKFPIKRPIPVHTVLGRLDEICKEEGCFATANLYAATMGTMLQFRAVTRLLTEEHLRALEQLRKLIDGTLYVSACPEDSKTKDGTDFTFRMVEVTIRTNGPVEVLPAAKRPT